MLLGAVLESSHPPPSPPPQALTSLLHHYRLQPQEGQGRGQACLSQAHRQRETCTCRGNTPVRWGLQSGGGTLVSL